MVKETAGITSFGLIGWRLKASFELISVLSRNENFLLSIFFVNARPANKPVRLPKPATVKAVSAFSTSTRRSRPNPTTVPVRQQDL